MRVGIIRPEHEPRVRGTSSPAPAATCRDPSSSGILRGGNHRSHCAASPAAHVSRSAGSIGRCSGRRPRFTLSRNHRIDPVHPTRSASTVAGMSGVSASSARTRGSNSVNDVGAGVRSYFGGPVRGTALITVVREIPNLLAIRSLRHTLRRQPPDQRPVLQSDHTPIVESVHFSSAVTVQFSTAADMDVGGHDYPASPRHESTSHRFTRTGSYRR